MTSSRPAPKRTAEPSARSGSALSWNAFVSNYVPALILALGTGIALPSIPALAQSYDVGFGLASGVVTVFLIGGVMGTMPAGWLIDRAGGRTVLILGPILTAAFAALVAVAHSFPELLAYRFLGGAAAQLWLMARLALISQRTGPDQRGRQVAWMFGMDNLGKLTGPVVGGLVASAWGLSAPFLVYAVLALVALIPAVLFNEREPRKSRTSSAAKATTLTLCQIVRPRLTYFALALFAGLARGPLQADLLHLYAAFAYDLEPRQIGYLATAAALVTMPIGFLAGWALDRIGRRKTMIPGFGGVAVFMVALAMSAYAHLSVSWYVALFLLAIAMNALTGGSVQTVGVDVAPPEARGKFLGVWRLTGQTGVATGPIVFALLADHVDYGSSFLFVAGASATVAWLLIRHIPEVPALGSQGLH